MKRTIIIDSIPKNYQAMRHCTALHLNHLNNEPSISQPPITWL
ncbi:MAG: hypothetical protein P1U67_14275 [Alcanivoracaceae bacterium]|nr:hypothetical protein [Alcanivoracaceae bacterium]